MTVALLTFAVSVYVPMAGGVNGGACVGRPAASCFAQTGSAACGAHYPRGTVFAFTDAPRLRAGGLPAVVVCRDRGSAIGARNLDLALVSGDTHGDLLTARAWGRRRVQALVFASPGALAAWNRTVAHDPQAGAGERITQ